MASAVFLGMGGNSHTYVTLEEADELMEAGVAQWVGVSFSRMALADGQVEADVWNLLESEDE